MNQIAQLPAAQEHLPRLNVVETVANRYGMTKDAFVKVVVDQVSPKGKDAKQLTNEQFHALMVVANEYGLNPITREMYAFPAKGGGVIPILSIDGWAGIVARHPKANGYDFSYEHDEKGNPISCTCTMYRKDRDHPIVVTEYLAECSRPTEPWKQFPRRMLRHKALIQCARYAFGFSGIYDEDEGRVIAEDRPTPASVPDVPDVPDNPIVDVEANAPAQEAAQPETASSVPSVPDEPQKPTQGRSKQPYAEMGGKLVAEMTIEPDEYAAKVDDFIARLNAAESAAICNEVWAEIDAEWDGLMEPDQEEIKNAYNERMGAFEG